jgi:hypothetical protein
MRPTIRVLHFPLVFLGYVLLAFKKYPPPPPPPRDVREVFFVRVSVILNPLVRCVTVEHVAARAEPFPVVEGGRVRGVDQR